MSTQYKKGDRWVKMGFRGIDGMLTHNGTPVPVREETELFALLNMSWPDPRRREWKWKR